ncbi:MAG TPA: PHP domain-containing protein [Candidatus Saccharimonadales bacterium]|nr:PHP domain-containing protein [Candidatus Saccharimonadales bacterium]
MNAPEQSLCSLGPDYFRPRDFEHVQPLYDLAYLLQIVALAKNEDVPEYRVFALWKAALSLDGYTTNVNRWLHGDASDDTLDSDPSSRIRDHLVRIEATGTIPELQALSSPANLACLRLRAVRGLGMKQVAETLSKAPEEWLSDAVKATGLKANALREIWEGTANSSWEAAHVVPPLLRLLRGIENAFGQPCLWEIPNLGDGLQPVIGGFSVRTGLPGTACLAMVVEEALGKDHFFQSKQISENKVAVSHILGWSMFLETTANLQGQGQSIEDLARHADALLGFGGLSLRGDLHSHTNWSDGAAALQTMADAAKEIGLEYLAITDHSRSSKLQGGVTPVSWIRQAVSLSLVRPGIKILHGIEADILADGTVDLPRGLLAGLDIVVGSVHSSWSDDHTINTNRILGAIESGCIDILGHPTATILGKPGVPNYYRPPIVVDWERIFAACKKWRVALEFNCFPSRLDLLLPLLHEASSSGCWISFGSDAHSRAHLQHLKIAQRVLSHIDPSHVLNLLSYSEIRKWLKSARKLRSTQEPEIRPIAQGDLFGEPKPAARSKPTIVRVATHGCIPAGSRVVGLDLTASKVKPTGVAVLDGMRVKTCSLESDEDIMAFIAETKPAIVSIDSPLGLPGGGSEISNSAGIMRMAEYDLNSVGISAYPALIDSMKPLTLRGIKLRREIEAIPGGPKVIESYPGAAQDVLCIPRKQKGLEFLRAGLSELGLKGPGLKTESHDEMDAITSAIVGRFYEANEFEPMGIPSEAQLIIPKLHPLIYERLPIVCLSGKTGAGKSVVARYLSLFYGFHWLRTREIIRALLADDMPLPLEKRMYKKEIADNVITDAVLRDFGIIVLEQYKQEPLIRKLHEMVAVTKRPVVVDAVRDLSDFMSLPTFHGEPVLWYVDASESAIRNRLVQRQKNGKQPIGNESRIDQKSHILKNHSNTCLRNESSLEDLRWAADDALFQIIQLKRQ